MILHGAVADNAWAFYAAQVRRDPTNVYFCSRLLEHGHRFGGTSDGEALIRAAALTVYKADPFAYVTSMTGLTWDLSDDDLNEISDGLDRAGDEDTTNFLRGKLWSDVVRGRKDAAPVARRALDYLERVSGDAAGREPDYWPAIAECYRVLDYTMYVRVLPKALESREPEWRAYDLLHGMEEAIKHEDWVTYAQWRERWESLPSNAHFCECSVNRAFTYDGVVALHRGNLTEIPGLLRRSLEVRGCPHLNSGGPSMKLVNALIDRRILLDDAQAYLDSAVQMFGEHEAVATARGRLAESQSVDLT